jgi:hypothetical protein
MRVFGHGLVEANEHQPPELSMNNPQCFGHCRCLLGDRFRPGVAQVAKDLCIIRTKGAPQSNQ